MVHALNTVPPGGAAFMIVPGSHHLTYAASAKINTAEDLAQLKRDHGKPDEGRCILAPVYDWFTEGFDTADLKKAKTLLEEIA